MVFPKYGFSDYGMTLVGLVLGLVAWRASRTDIYDGTSLMCRFSYPGKLSVNEALVLAARSMRLLGRFRMRNTCLVRALTVGALLCRRHEVVLHIGFRPVRSADMLDSADGHAWLNIDGADYLLDDKDSDAYRGLVSVNMR